MLEIDGVAVSFGGVHAVRGVTFRAEVDHVTGVVGPNGAGKTTLFNIVTGFQRPDRGTVSFDGVPIVNRKPSRIARAGLVRTFQKTEIFAELTVGRAVEIGTLCGRSFPLWRILSPGAVARTRAAAAREVAAILDLCGIAGVSDRLCDALSYGEQRLLEVALALAARPRMILLDEPASGLNPTEARRLGDLIGEIRARNVGVVLIEHNMQLVKRVSDRIVVLHHGEKIAEGRPAAVLSDPRVVEAYLGAAPAHA